MLMTTNVNGVVTAQLQKLKNLADTDRMVRTVATSVLDLMKRRIHHDGLDSNGQQIGTYSAEYMKVRTGNFANSERFKKGKNKGGLKNAGVFTDATIRLDRNTGVFSGEDKVGKPRPNYNRSDDTKVIFSLTRQMENDFKVVAITPGSYGLGFSNELNYNKSQWCEAIYHKEGQVYRMSQAELATAVAIANKFLNDAAA